jgi:hypothetical protein
LSLPTLCTWEPNQKALTAIINVLNHYPTACATAATLGPDQFWELLGQYTASHTTEWSILKTTPWAMAQKGLMLNGTGYSWIAESGSADDAEWTDLATEGYWYNHATFNDLVLSGVVGLQPSAPAGVGDTVNATLTVNPLVPAGALHYFAADGVRVHNRVVTVLYDDGTSVYGGRYHGKDNNVTYSTGLTVLLDGEVAAFAPKLQKITVQL